MGQPHKETTRHKFVMTTARRSISAVARSDTIVPPSGSSPAPRRSLSSVVNAGGATGRAARLSLNEKGAREGDRAALLRRQSLHQKAAYSGSETAADLTAYFAFSRRRSSVVSEDEAGAAHLWTSYGVSLWTNGLSGFLEYRKLDGSWRPFLFQSIGYQLVVFRVHVTHQVQVMTTDIRDASEIELVDDGDINNTRLFRLGINGTVITLRAVSHHVAMYWVDGLRELRAGRLPEITFDRPTVESEDDIFQQIDRLSQLREWRPPPSTVSASLCGVCFPCLPRLWNDSDASEARRHSAAAAAFITTQSPRPLAR